MFGKKYNTATTDEMPTTQPLTAGCGRVVTVEELLAIADQFNEKRTTHEEDVYIAGFISGLQFGGVPSDKEVYGMDVTSFEENAYAWFAHDMMKDEMRMVIDILQGIIGDDDAE